uniref:S-adenosylmethionine:tRNA ribosyltransferase-isomerase n=1 Tax=Candidatus Kentrum sp. MB TaxID=2138164 RepID=A0A451B8I5_9GAMM|nr:MAG: S-adenosylmethionine:tRNA ribosyltransferase-isomerase [Candidatus Kentron sp. MB]VFK74571.1 MAG: S-adenosylmethionine:tRNA ribosyltransferase-isomerase [Candidatus Kentron sp. MB]
MQVSDFHYDLPEELIAQYPTDKRTASRLLVLDRDTGALQEATFSDLPRFLVPGDLLVFNDTRVIPARLFGRKATGGRVEILVERIVDERHILAQVRGSKSLRTGMRIELMDSDPRNVMSAKTFEDTKGPSLEVRERRGEFFVLQATGAEGIEDLLQNRGRVPLPPYIQRASKTLDEERYQTVFAKRKGAVAAPTAGLHFDESLLARLRSMGVESAFVTLHVGAGTFAPLRVSRVEEHKIHAEYLEVSEESCAIINRAHRAGRCIIAVGTTSVRALETAWKDGELHPFRGDTDLFIYPGYRFRCVDALISNFHLPGSTLLMLVSAFAGRERTLNAYRYAVEKRFRFYSYGDAMFFSRLFSS